MPGSRVAAKEARMTRGRAAIAAVVIAAAMALAGAGISHTRTDPTRPVVSDRSLSAEVDISGDKAVLVAGPFDVSLGGGEERSRGSF
jgi:hypothetical protein